MKFLKGSFVAGLMVLGIVNFLSFVSAAEDTYYTKVNIWYEDPGKIVSTNYHRGAILPYGSKVNSLSISGQKIKFTVEDPSGVTFVLTNMAKHSLKDAKELSSDYFTKDNPKVSGGEFSKFSGKEKDNIENGTLEEGMSKEAVIAAYGYPPKHKTPTLSSNLWTYWDARAVRRLATFKNNKLTKHEEVNEYEESGGYHPRWYHYVP